MIPDTRHPSRIAFRADASVQIGTGHVMRCLTLADALCEDGAECLFLCRPHDGHLLELVSARGHRAIALPARDAATSTAPDQSLPAHAHWLGTDWMTDGQDCLEALAGRSVDWLVADHYALDRRWQRTMRSSVRRLMVIDDLADRPHDCDLLLDQNLGRRAEDYSGLLPSGAQMLIGPHYALLRPEFAALRAESLARRRHPQLKNLLITMGGVDKDNATGAVLTALQCCDLPSDLHITVVLGPHAPWLAQVRSQAETMPWRTRVLAGVNDMARLMLEADLAIGAAGSTSWERCCLGLPTIQLVLAENQRCLAAALQEAGAAVIAADARQIVTPLQGKLSSGGLSELLQAMSLAASGVTDGDGAKRVRHHLVT